MFRLISISLVTLLVSSACLATPDRQDMDDQHAASADEWLDIQESKACKLDKASSACEALELQFYCRHAGDSRNAAKCEAGRRAKVEKDLNRLYASVLAGLRKLAASQEHWAALPRLLLESERAWIKFRAAQCELAAEEFHQGSLQPAMHERCLSVEAERRIEWLQALARQYEL